MSIIGAVAFTLIVGWSLYKGIRGFVRNYRKARHA